MSVDAWLRGGEPAPWELFHENSKTSRHERHPTFATWPSDAAIVRVMRRLRQAKPYADRPKVELPAADPDPGELADTIARRVTARAFGGDAIPLAAVAEVLRLSYAVNRDNAGTTFPRPFRMVPSGGALYPLELYLHAAAVDGLAPGLYHYDPLAHRLDVLRAGAIDTGSCFVQADLAAQASAAVFVTAVFARTTFKYGDRGYRFVLLEAGHLAQNASLVATALGVAAASVGGYLDRDVDRLLAVDGVSESTVYALLLGTPAASGEAAAW
jgi:SagB-type dehydrogenase family enzyme